MPIDNLQELFASLSNALVLYARQWCRTPEDAVQEAFIDLANCSSEPTYPKAWLYTTTRRKAQNIARAESRHRNHLEQWIQESGADRAGG
jgi:RNA polymerase sigma-70 factor (ECF subfamily)